MATAPKFRIDVDIHDLLRHSPGVRKTTRIDSCTWENGRSRRAFPHTCEPHRSVQVFESLRHRHRSGVAKASTTLSKKMHRLFDRFK